MERRYEGDIQLPAVLLEPVGGVQRERKGGCGSVLSVDAEDGRGEGGGDGIRFWTQ